MTAYGVVITVLLISPWVVSEVIFAGPHWNLFSGACAAGGRLGTGAGASRLPAKAH